MFTKKPRTQYAKSGFLFYDRSSFLCTFSFIQSTNHAKAKSHDSVYVCVCVCVVYMNIKHASMFH